MLNSPYQWLAMGGQEEEETPHQRVVVAAPGMGERDELAQRLERDEPEQNDDAALADPERHRQHAHHPPPGVDAGVEVVDDGSRGARRQPPLEYGSNAAGNRQRGENRSKHVEQGVIGAHRGSWVSAPAGRG